MPSFARQLLRWALLFPVLLPLLWLLFAWLPGELASGPASGNWLHLLEYTLPDAGKQTALLLMGVAILVAILGGVSGWIQARYQYPGRRLVDVLLIAPMAMPSYVVAFVYVGSSDVDSLFNQLLRPIGASAPSIQGPFWAAWVFALCLYPYVYLLTRASARNLSQSFFDSADLLGLTRWQKILRIWVPLLRPALALGICLALMETLADFGAASILGLDTLTTVVYKTWYSLFDLRVAAQLASLMIGLFAILLFFELRARRKIRSTTSGKMVRVNLKGARAGLPWLWHVPLLSFALCLPLAQLLRWALQQNQPHSQLWAQLSNSLYIAGIAATWIGFAGLIFVLTAPRSAPPSSKNTFEQEAYGIGYAVPGTVLAVAILLMLGNFAEHGQWLLATLLALLLALWARFARMSTSPLEARFAQVSSHLGEAAQGLGLSPWQRFRNLYFPLLRQPVVLAWLMVFVEVLKELPATLVLRPVGWDTLAIGIYGFCSEGLWQQAAFPALLLSAAGVFSVAIVSWGEALE